MSQERDQNTDTDHASSLTTRPFNVVVSHKVVY